MSYGFLHCLSILLRYIYYIVLQNMRKPLSLALSCKINILAHSSHRTLLILLEFNSVLYQLQNYITESPLSYVFLHYLPIFLRYNNTQLHCIPKYGDTLEPCSHLQHKQRGLTRESSSLFKPTFYPCTVFHQPRPLPEGTLSCRYPATDYILY